MIAAYLGERCRPIVFAPLAIVIAAAGGATSDPVRLAVDTCVALLLLAEFRLWDDLADRRGDSFTHPDRVLVRAASVGRFVVFVIALAVINIAVSTIRDDSGVALAAILGLHGVLGLWYARRSRRTLAGDQLLLAKYPAFVVTVAGGRAIAEPFAIGVAACAVYATASIYEAWHDPASPAAMLIGRRS